MSKGKTRRSTKDGRTRAHLIEMAQAATESFKPPYRAVVIVTDEAGDFVGVGMNTTLRDAVNMMKCALYADGFEFHDAKKSPPRKPTPQKSSAYRAAHSDVMKRAWSKRRSTKVGAR